MMTQERFEKTLQHYEEIYSERLTLDKGYYLICAYQSDLKIRASLVLGEQDTLTFCMGLWGRNPANLVKKLRKQRDLLRVEKNKTSELTSLQAC